jgi:integrase
MSLTDTAIKAAKPRDKQYKLSDEKGLLILVCPSGGKLWRFKYRLNGKEQQLALGAYPDVGLKVARERRDQARKLLAEGRDPGNEKKRAAVAAALSASNTFGVVAEELISKMVRESRAPATVKKAQWHLSRLANLVARPIAEIEPYELLEVLKKLEARGNLEAARQVRSFASRVFRYGIATTRCRHDVAATLIGALVSPKPVHHAAILDPAKVGELLRAIDGFEGQPATHLALRLAPHVFVRPGELRHAEWTEIDLDAAIWTVPAKKTKMRKDHLVPLSKQAIYLLEQAKSVLGFNKMVFPGMRGTARPLSENTFNAALRRMGYAKDEMTAHGFRAMASTLLNQSGKWRPDTVERALAHGDRDAVRAAYNRGEYWQERVEMAQWWSDYLDSLKAGGGMYPTRGR